MDNWLAVLSSYPQHSRVNQNWALTWERKPWANFTSEEKTSPEYFRFKEVVLSRAQSLKLSSLRNEHVRARLTNVSFWYTNYLSYSSSPVHPAFVKLGTQMSRVRRSELKIAAWLMTYNLNDRVMIVHIQLGGPECT